MFVCLIVCDIETSTVRWPRTQLDCCATGKEQEYCNFIINCVNSMILQNEIWIYFVSQIVFPLTSLVGI